MSTTLCWCNPQPLTRPTALRCIRRFASNPPCPNKAALTLGISTSPDATIPYCPRHAEECLPGSLLTVLFTEVATQPPPKGAQTQ